MPILNMVYSTNGGGGPNIPLDAIDDLSVAPGNAEATITWTDPGDLVVHGYTLTSWTSTKLVRKTGSAPSSSSDGTLVLTETVMNQYSSTGYTDTGLTNGTTYYYAAFAVGDNGTESISDVRNVTPAGGWTPGADTVGYYPLTSTTTNTDQSGNGRDFTANGSVTYGTYGGVDCCSINQGQLKYLFSNSADYLPSSGDYTISLWYYHVANPSQDNGQMAQFSYGSDMGATRVGMDIPVTRPSDVSNKPGLSIITNAGGTFSSPAISLAQNSWYHCVVTKNSYTLTLYVNGVSSATTSYGGSGDLGCYGISRAASSTRSIIGYVSNAIFEKKCWTVQEIEDYFDNTKADYGYGPRTPGANTRVYLTLNDSLADTSGNNHDATQQSGGTTTRPYIIGSSGDKYYHIEGTPSGDTDCCIMGSYGTALGTGQRTISCWVKFDSAYNSGEATPICLGDTSGGNGRWFGLWTVFGNQYVGIIRYYSDPHGSTGSWICDTNWHHYAITYDNTNKGKMYVDGAAYTLTSDASSSFDTTGTDYLIGVRRTVSRGIGFSKFILEDKVWTASEVANYYNNTKSDYGIS